MLVYKNFDFSRGGDWSPVRSVYLTADPRPPVSRYSTVPHFYSRDFGLSSSLLGKKLGAPWAYCASHAHHSLMVAACHRLYLMASVQERSITWARTARLQIGSSP